MAKRLFDDDDHDHDHGDNVNAFPSSQPSSNVLKVNLEYAKRLAHNKQREASHRLQELKKSGVVDSSDDSSDDESSDDGFIPSRTEVRILDTLAKIKKKDPSIYSEEVKFFDDEDDGEEDSAGMQERSVKKMPKPVYLKDAIAKQLIEEGSDFDDDFPKGKTNKRIVTYVEEQQELKDEFLRTANIDEDEDDDGDTGGFLTVRKKQNNDGDQGDVRLSVTDKVIEERLEEYFGRDENLDENEKFLKDFLLKKSWVDEDEGKIPAYEEVVGDLLEDEEELEKQEKFEAGYNFRFEEGMSSQVMGYSRIVEDSVRRKDDKRKEIRLKKKKRLADVASERREELKRLKNIKKKEILEKLEKIRNVAGAQDAGHRLLKVLGDEELEEDFDPEEYDKKMKEVFGEEYYGAEDPDEDELQKPDFDAEDETLGLADDWDDNRVGKRSAGFAAAQERAKQLKSLDSHNKREDYDDDNDVPHDLVNAELAEPEEESGIKTAHSRRKKRSKIPLREKLAFDKTLDEYYKLDYEDIIGDLPTRFKYKEVQPNMYGLTAAEILTADDKDLNQYVSLKKLAPYRTVEWKPKFRFQGSQKIRKKQALNRQNGLQGSTEQKGALSVDGVENVALSASSESLKQEVHQTDAGVEGSKRKRKRKKGLLLSVSRLIAYGKIQPKRKRRA